MLRRNPSAPRPPFLAPAGTVVFSVIAVISDLWLLSNSPWNEMRLAVTAVLLGFGLYFAYAAGRGRLASGVRACAVRRSSDIYSRRSMFTGRRFTH